MRRILVVDDELEMADTIATLLKFRGYETDVAMTGIAAIQIAKHQDIGLVLLDWNLAGDGLNGIKLVHRLRELCGGGVPVVVVSADPQALGEALRADVSDYLPKPFVVADLLRIVDEYCVWPDA